MRQYLEPDDIINNIKLLLKHPFYSDKLILVVEGKNDIRFFDHYLTMRILRLNLLMVKNN